MLTGLWSALVGLADTVLSWVVLAIGAVLNLLVDVIEAAAVLFLSWIPDAETVSHSEVSSLWAQFVNANQYVPLDLAATLLAAWSVLYGMVSLYKLWKAVPFV